MTAMKTAQQNGGAVVDLAALGSSSDLSRFESRLQVLRGLLDASGRLQEVNEAIQCSTDRHSALLALQSQPFGYSRRQAEAILDMPMSWQSADSTERLRAELDDLASIGEVERERVAEVLALHWFG